VLFNVVGGRNLGLGEVYQAAKIISDVVDPDAEIVFGAAIDPDLGDEVKVTVIAAGFEAARRREPEVDEEHEPTDQDDNARHGGFRSDYMPNVDTELPAFLRRGVTAR
jgi:cell division protein FtsZ